MRRSSLITTIALGAAVAASDAEARLDVYVDKSTQQLSVIQNGSLLYVWPVSTGRDKFSTPNGVYTPERLERSWFSKAYYNSAMPHAIFFHNGYAIHGSYDISKLGGPASHGCVRLHPRDAALLYALVEREGPSNTAIFIGGSSNRPSLRYRNLDDPAPPAYRRDDSVARGAPPGPVMPRGDGADGYGDGTGAYPPPGSRTSPYYLDRYGDGRSAYPPGPDTVPYYDANQYVGTGRSVAHGPRIAPDYRVDPYVDSRGDPQGPRVAPGYDVDPYGNARGVPRGPRFAPDHEVNPYVDAQGAPRVAPDYNVNPYPDGRGAPRGPDLPPYYQPNHQDDVRGAYQHGPRTPPYGIDRNAGEPAQRRGDRLTMRGNYPVPHRDGETPVDRTPHSGSRPLSPGAKSKPGRLVEEPPNRHVTVGDAAKAPLPVTSLPAASLPAMPWQAAPLQPAPLQPAPLQPAPLPASTSLPSAAPPSTPPAKPDPSPEQHQSNVGYKVLPRSYWAGASWRWRIKRDEDGAAHDAQ